MVTHDVQEAFEMGDRICLMDKGMIKQIGTPEELLFHPANDFVSAFFEEQRLQLELKSVLLAEILPGYARDSTTTVWDKMNTILNPQLNMTHDPEQETEKPKDDDQTGNLTDIKVLMGAFEAYKKR